MYKKEKPVPVSCHVCNSCRTSWVNGDLVYRCHIARKFITSQSTDVLNEDAEDIEELVEEQRISPPSWCPYRGISKS